MGSMIETATSPASPATGACLHCRAPVSPGASFCCTGCEAVHTAIASAGLGDWAKLRDVDRDALLGVAARPRVEARYDYLDSDAYRAGHCGSVRFADRERPGFEATWAVDGMTCVACAWLIEEVAKRQPGVREARVDLLGQRLELRCNDDVKLAPLAQELGTFGYGVGVGEREDPGRARRRDLVDVAIAGAIMGNTMILVLPYYFGLQTGQFAEIFGWLALVLGAVSLVVPGRVFFVNANAALRMRHVSLDIPIALGLAAAWLYSAVQLSRGVYEELYLDSLVMLVFSLRLGRFFQARTVERAAARAKLLASAMPELVPTLREGAWVQVAPEELRVGETIRLDPGARLPVEAELIAIVQGATESREGVAHVDLQVVSGEETPRPLRVGETLPAGAKAVDDAMVLRVREESVAAQLLQSGTAGLRRTPMLADRLGSVFTFVVLALALAGFGYWAAQTGIGDGLRVAMIVLIVACPCAIGLATPATAALTIAAAARRGVLVREVSALERLGKLRHVVFDKTGTVTEGRPEVIDVRWWVEGATRDLVAAALADLEGTARHPIARGLLRWLEAAGWRERSTPTTVRILGGEGIEGEARGVPLVALSFAAALRRGLAATIAPADALVRSVEGQGASVVVVLRGDGGATSELVAAFAMRDALRADAADTVRRLRDDHGMQVTLLSGDALAAVEAVAARLGVHDAVAEVDPAAKAARVAALEAAGAVAMVGDGQNDVEALRGASLSVSLAGATPAAIASSEIVLQSGGLGGLVWLMERAAAARRAILATLVFAAVYNAVGVAWALSGRLTPLAAALLMPLSSISVVAIAVLASRRADHAGEREVSGL